MKAVVRNAIEIVGCAPELESYFKRLLTFDNPEYYKRQNAGRWIGDMPKEIRLYERRGRSLVLPFGMLPEIFKRKSAFDEIVNELTVADSNGRYSRFYGSRIIPYSYQENAIVAALKSKQGVIVAPCGAGKTQIGLEIAARLGMRTLWLTHTHDLLKQSMDRAKSVFGLDASEYGTITAGKVDIGNTITFATVQTMVKLDLPQYRNCWDVVIVDEAHHVAGTPTRLMMFYKVISNLCARYKYGLTATPQRSDGLTPCMFALIGPKVYEITKSDVEKTTCPVYVDIRQTEYVPDVDSVLLPDGTLNYAAFITAITKDENRNQQIAKDALDCEGTVLILTDRIEHICRLQSIIGDCAVALMANKKKERKLAIENLSNEKSKILIATFALAREGLDIPSLRNVIFATPQKNEQIVTQAAGRVARKADGKEFGVLIDYEDDFGMLQRWQRRRTSVYRKLGFTLR